MCLALLHPSSRFCCYISWLPSSPWRFLIGRSLHSTYWVSYSKILYEAVVLFFKGSHDMVSDIAPPNKVKKRARIILKANFSGGPYIPRLDSIFYQWLSSLWLISKTLPIQSLLLDRYHVGNFIKFFIFLSVEVFGRWWTCPLEEIAAKIVAVSLKRPRVIFFAFVILFRFSYFNKNIYIYFSGWGLSALEMLLS